MGRRRREESEWREKRGGIWYAFYYTEKPRRICRESLKTGDEQLARIRFAEWIFKGTRGAHAVDDAGVTVEQALDWYEKEHVEVHVTDKTRQYNATAHLRVFFKDRLLKDVDVFVSRGYAEARRRGDVGGGKRRKTKVGGNSTIRRELNVLTAAANHAVRFHKTPKDQLPTIELPVETKKKTPWLTKAQVRLVFNSADGKLRDFCMLAYYWGARRASIEFLKKNQIDLQHSRVDLNAVGAKLTKKRRPIVPIYPEIRSVVEKLLEASDTEFLFGKPEDFYRRFVNLCRDNKIDAQDMPAGKDPWPHLLRHSRAAHMLMDGEDPYKVAKLLGDTMGTVERVYGHHSVDYLNTTSTVSEVA